VAEFSPTIFVIDDDDVFRRRVAQALRDRGYETTDFSSPRDAIAAARREPPEFAVVDLRMPGGKSGLDLVSELVKRYAGIQIVILTGYGSIATAVEAVRQGAINYLSKPADADQILAAFDHEGEGNGAHAVAADAVETTPSLARVEYEHIQRILSDCGGNISLAARKLGIHRRSLQRKLSKLPPLE